MTQYTGMVEETLKFPLNLAKEIQLWPAKLTLITVPSRL